MFNSVSEITIEKLQANYQMINYFGLGFIQLKINDTYRLHFYSPNLKPTVSQEEVHNHRYDFKSTILKGLLTQEIFQVIEGDTHQVSLENCAPTPKVPMPSKDCALKFMQAQVFTPGSIYYIAHDTFHRVQGENCITLVERKPYAKHFAEVVKTKNSPFVCPFATKIPEEDLWYIVHEMLNQTDNQLPTN